MYKAVIIADDFTSVTDCGVQFTKHGLVTTAFMNLPDTLPAGEILSIDMDSRPLSPLEAYKKVYRVAEQVKASGCKRIYKSIDSTLRGNLGAEINAVMDAMDIPAAIVAPAFPLYGRTTIGGIHYLNGMPLAESSLARDPVSPMLKSGLADILREQTSREMGHVPLDKLRAGEEQALSAVRDLLSNGAQLVLFDAGTEADLELVARLAAYLPEALVVGSTGLAQYMAEGWRIARQESAAPLPEQGKPVLFAAATASPVTANQIAQLLKRSGTYGIMFDPWDLVDTQGKNRMEEARAALAQGRDVILYLNCTPESRTASAREVAERGVAEGDFSKMIVSAMAGLTRLLLDTGFLGGLFMTGGDTAKTLCAALGSDGMELLGEIEAGIPYGWLTGPRRILAATKAGAFGTPEALCSAKEIMRNI